VGVNWLAAAIQIQLLLQRAMLQLRLVIKV